MVSDRTGKGRKQAKAIEAAEAELLVGYGPLSVIERSAIRLAAHLVVRIDEPRSGDDPVKLSETLSRLMALLPPRSSDTPQALDLSALSDDDLDTLERLVAKAPKVAEPELTAAVELVERLNAENSRMRQENDALRVQVDAMHEQISVLSHEIEDMRRAGGPAEAAGVAGAAAALQTPAPAAAVPEAAEAVVAADAPTGNVVPLLDRDEAARLRRAKAEADAPMVRSSYSPPAGDCGQYRDILSPFSNGTLP
jgi:hypothetical protein